MLEQPSMSWGVTIFLFLGAIALITVMALVIKLFGRKAVLLVLGIVGGLALFVSLVLLAIMPRFVPTQGRQTSVTASRSESDGREYSRSVTVMDEVKTLENGQPSNLADMEWKPSADTDYIVDTNPLSDRTELYISLLPWLVLLTIITLIAILILVLLRRKSVLWILGIVGGLALMGLFWVSLWLWPSESIRQTSVTTSRMESDGHGYSRSVAVVEDVDLSGNAPKARAEIEVDKRPYASHAESWKPSDEIEFPADLYPSAESAIVATTRKLLNELETTGVLTKPGKLYLIVDANYSGEASALALALERKMMVENVILRGQQVPASLPSEDLTLMIATPEEVDNTGEVKTVEVNMSHHTQSFHRQIRYTTKIWVEQDPVGIFGGYPNDHFNFVTYSNGLFSSPEEAEQSALNDAVERIKTEIASRYNFKHYDTQSGLRTAIESFLKHGDISISGCRIHQSYHPIMDRFCQRFDRPYGRIWRQAICVSVQPRAISGLAELYRTTIRQQQIHTGVTWGSIAGMILLITVVYLFLNAATRGYYVWSLRVAGVVIVVAGVLLVLNYA